MTDPTTASPGTAVAVVIPAHRVDRWLDEAVASTLASAGVNFDVVVVVNGVDAIPDRPWMHHERVRTLHVAEALGPTLAMIHGLDATSAPYVARLDADDRMHPERLRRQVEWMKQHPDTPLVGTAARRIDENGDDRGAIRMPTGPDIRSHLVLSNTVPHSSVLMRRTDLDAIGGYDARLAQMEDYHVILRLAQRGPIAVLPDELTDYRIHDGQVSRGAGSSGAHIVAIIAERSRLGRVLGMSRLAVALRNVLWRAVQHARFHGLIRAGHEY